MARSIAYQERLDKMFLMPLTTPFHKAGHSDGKVAFIHFLSGYSAAAVELACMHPTDVIKVRFQLQTGSYVKTSDPSRYSSMYDCLRKIVQSEGALAAYKGIVPPAILDIPRRASNFFVFEQTKLHIYRRYPAFPEIPTFIICGFLCGFFDGFVGIPFETVKVTQQAERMIYSEQKTAYTTARDIIKRDGWGVRGICKGYDATLARHSIFHTIYFTFYHTSKSEIVKRTGKEPNMLLKFLMGFTGGAMACCVNIPTDVAKSRIQAPQPHGRKYKTLVQTMKLVRKEEGLLALYKGLVPKITRFGPGGAILFVVFEKVYDHLKRTL